MHDPVLSARVEDYAERLKEHHWRLVRWATTVVPFPLVFGPRVLGQMSPSMRTGLVFTWGGMVAAVGLAVILSSWRFHRAYGVQCPVCRASLSAEPELFLRVGECPQCRFQRARTATQVASGSAAHSDSPVLPSVVRNGTRYRRDGDGSRARVPRSTTRGGARSHPHRRRAL